MTEARAPTGLEGHGLRLTIAIFGAAVLPYAAGDHLAMLMGAMFAVVLNQPGAPTPTLARALVVPAAIWLVGRIAEAALMPLAPHDDVVIVVSCAVVFLCFRHEARHGPAPVTGLVLLIVVVVVPAAVSLDGGAGRVVDTLGLGALSAALSGLLAHLLVPAPPASHDSSSLPWRASVAPLRESIGRTAILSVLLASYVLADKVNELYVLITAVMLLRLPEPRTAAVGLLGANVLGGVIALTAAVFMQVVPSVAFDLLLFAAVALSLGRIAEAGGAAGAVAQQATSVTIILLALALLPTDGTAAYVDRVVGIALTVVVVLLARNLFEAPRPDPAAPSPA